MARQYLSRRPIDILTGNLRALNNEVALTLTSLGGAKDPAMVGASVALAKAWRKVLSVRGGAKVTPNPSGKYPEQRASGGIPSKPGEPPRRQTGALRRSVSQGPVGTGRRVALVRFTALILEEGADTRKPAPSGRRRAKRVKTGLGYRITPRPSAQRAFDMAKDEMVKVFAERTGDQLRTTFG